MWVAMACGWRIEVYLDGSRIEGYTSIYGNNGRRIEVYQKGHEESHCIGFSSREDSMMLSQRSFHRAGLARF